MDVRNATDLPSKGGIALSTGRIKNRNWTTYATGKFGPNDTRFDSV